MRQRVRRLKKTISGSEHRGERDPCAATQASSVGGDLLVDRVTLTTERQVSVQRESEFQPVVQAKTDGRTHRDRRQCVGGITGHAHGCGSRRMEQSQLCPDASADADAVDDPKDGGFQRRRDLPERDAPDRCTCIVVGQPVHARDDEQLKIGPTHPQSGTETPTGFGLQ